MGRHKEFNRDQALRRAMEVFWLQGYDATSIQDLVTRMGINRQSLYDTFGDKHSLYLLSLDLYRKVEAHRRFEVLERQGSAKRSIRQLFEGVVEEALRDTRRRGCFIGNATSQLAGRCTETKARTRANLAEAETAFYNVLLRGKKEGELKGIRDPRAVARFLYCSLQGLLLMSKTTQDRKTLEDIVRVTLSVLE
ncbi:MAG TPA: TetR family transcriptional regulator [Blastocatellia bacterium]|nr:TetR family transcriptional regulator [Blastocatellia bacterium]